MTLFPIVNKHAPDEQTPLRPPSRPLPAATLPFTAVIVAALFIVSIRHFLLFHILAEGISIIIATGMCVVAWHTRKYTVNDFLLFLGISFQAVAILDFMHLITYQGMNILSVTDANQATQYWVIARFLEAAALAAAPYFFRHRYRVHYFIPAGLILTSATISAVSLFKIFPRCFVAPSGLTPFKIIAEYAIIAILIPALVHMYRSRSHADRSTVRLLLLSTVLTILSEFMFTLYHSPYGTANFTGHILKLAAYFLIYRAIIVGTLERPFSSLFKDISRTNRLLRTSEQRYALAQRAANIGTWEWHIADDKLHWSEQVEPMLGLEPGSFSGDFHDFLNLVHPDDRQPLSGALRSCIVTRQDNTMEHRIVRPDGSVRWVRESASPIATTDGSPGRVIGIITDITLEHREKEELRVTMEKQADALADTKVILEQVSSQKYLAEEQLQQRQHALEAVYHIVTTLPPSLSAIAGQAVRNISEIIGLDAVVFTKLNDDAQPLTVRFIDGELTDDTTQRPVCPFLKDLASGGTSIQYTGDPAAALFGEKCPCARHGYRSFLAVPVTVSSTEVAGAICAMRSEETHFDEYNEHIIGIFARLIAYEMNRGTLELRMQQSREMRLLGQLTSGVAHEVRNPLNALMAISEALFKKIDQVEMYGQYMDHIRNQIRRLSRLMEDLLALGRPIRAVDFTPVDVMTMIDDALFDWSRISPERGGRITVKTDGEYRAVTVATDTVKMQQVLMNILDNAEHHSPPEGPILITVSNADGNKVRIVITDSGSGIAPTDLGRIFDPFFTTRRSGTGLGLSIVKNTVEHHGGSVWIVNNDPPPGASVEIHLPVVEPLHSPVS